MSNQISLFICEDNEVTSLGLQMVLGKNPEFSLAGTARTGEELLEAAENRTIDVAIVDLHLAGAMSGFETTRRLKQINPKMAVVILTGAHDLYSVRAAVHAGANAYCLKNSCASRIAAAVLSAYRGSFWIDPRLTISIVPALDGNVFSKDEIMMLELWSQGLSMLEIAKKLQSSVHNVNGCAHRLFDKLQIQERTESAFNSLMLQP